MAVGRVWANRDKRTRPPVARRWRGGRLTLRRALVTLLAVVTPLAGLLYAGAAVYLGVRVTRGVRSRPEGTPADVGLTYETVSFESAVDHVPLRGWYMPARGERAVILVHGVDMHRWDPWCRLADKARLYVQHGFDVLTFDLRTHGESGGEHFGLGWLERRDVQGAVTCLARRGIPAGRIGLHGHSFGGGIALLSAAAIPDVAAVLADSPFADARPLLSHELRLRGLPSLLTPGIVAFVHCRYGLDFDAMPPARAMAQIAPRPVLLIHGTADDRIPIAHSFRLKAASPDAGVELWVVPGAGHVQAFNVEPAAYAERMLRFFDRAIPAEGANDAG